jgi:transcriptional regulator with XRE-family HTH domain
MLAVSKKLKETIRLSDKRHYQIAQQARLHPSTLSRLICGIENVKPSDDRVIRLGQVLGIPVDECFQDDRQ